MSTTRLAIKEEVIILFDDIYLKVSMNNVKVGIFENTN